MRILAILPVLALAACQQAGADPRGVDRDETLLTVSATGQAEAKPDEARFTLGVDTLAGSAREATRLNNEKTSKVIAALMELGVKEEQVQTRTLNLGRIDYGKDRGRYRASNMVEVRMGAVEKAGDAVTAATEAGANVMRGPQLVVSDPEAATKSAYAEAYRNARIRADAYAEAAGLKVGRILTIRDNGAYGGGYPPPIVSMDAAMNESAAVVQTAPAPPPAPFQPGVNRQTVSVSVAFALEQAS
ncbi:SIMPL domain-containing protein [Sphingomicrobium nitratireducens]|uniref:SIMPL domain-containing protein n=1 Tax=Sphingomicrobium nitratireducens TaxID=2964666 RepID=UPI00223FA42D|nr:SIMPL domain-containing protein [Sphingomicrobium nitratireducens]